MFYKDYTRTSLFIVSSIARDVVPDLLRELWHVLLTFSLKQQQFFIKIFVFFSNKSTVVAVLPVNGLKKVIGLCLVLYDVLQKGLPEQTQYFQ